VGARFARRFSSHACTMPNTTGTNINVETVDVLKIDIDSLPIIWDADFLYGPRTASGEDTYVLCEINVSSVFAIPDQAPAAIARLVKERLRGPKSRK